MKSNEWYREEVAKLLAIVKQDDNRDFIHKDYLDEKLSRILHEIGIGIHPTLKPVVDKILKRW